MRIIIVLFLFFSSLVLVNCKNENPLTEKEEHQKLITSGIWTLEHLTIDGVEETLLFSGMTLQFTDTGFTASNGFPIWPNTSSWKFLDEAGSKMVRDGNVQISINEITNTKLVLSLQWDKSTFAAGRANSIEGIYIFTFKK